MNNPALATDSDAVGPVGGYCRDPVGTEGDDVRDVHYLRDTPVAAARLSQDGNTLTIMYADGASRLATPVDPAAAAEIVTELGLIPGGTSNDGVRHWWR